jgi:hypothetical protein
MKIVFIKVRHGSGVHNARLRKLPRGWCVRTLRVRTHQQSRVESNPVQSDSQRHGSGLLTMDTAAVHTHQQSRVTRILLSHMSRDAACFIFISQTPVIRRDGRNGCREAYSSSEGPRGNLRRLTLWTPELRLTLMKTMFITKQQDH